MRQVATSGRPLSKRQAQVDELDARGFTPRQIADVLRISTQRVYQHLRAIEEKRSEAKRADAAGTVQTPFPVSVPARSGDEGDKA